MATSIHLADHLGPDTIDRLENAAVRRFEDAEHLVRFNRRLTAIYLYGYSAEMCLSAAYFRSVGFSSRVPIDRDIRRLRMAKARQLRGTVDEPLMNSDPHPIVGWARFLEWQRKSSSALTEADTQRLREAVKRAERIYRHWRPELRYKTTDVAPAQLAEVRSAAQWFIEIRGRL